MELGEIRQEIDAIDEEMAKLFVRRMACADQVAAAKRTSGKAVLDPGREREILAKVAEWVGPGLETEGKILLSTLMSISRGRQRTLLAEGGAFAKMIADAMSATPALFPSKATVACPGAEGGYSQQAAVSFVQFPSLLYFRDFESVFAAVEQGMCDYGVLPIENSTAGSVTQVYDLMAKHDFRIVKGLKLRIRHALLAPKGVKLADVKEVASHPHALAQCAELYGLDILADDISDTPSNFTRFICISRKTEIYPDANKFSLMMSLPHRPGALADVLVRFSASGVNLTKLESRPVVGSDFEFRFIFDFEASPRDERVVKLLSSLAGDPDVEHFTFLGADADR